MRRIAECKNRNPVASIYRVTYPFQLNTCPEHISESIEGNEMKLNILIEGVHNARTITLSPLLAELQPFV